MLKFDSMTTIFLCIAILLYVGDALTQNCIERLLNFFDWALQWLKATSRMRQYSLFRFPKTVERLVELFNIGSKEKVFACCPECFQLYTLPDYQPLEEPILELPRKGLPERRRTANDKGKGKERGGKGKGKEKRTKAQPRNWEDTSATSDIATSDIANDPPSPSILLPRPPSLLPRCSYRATPTSQPCNARLSQSSHHPQSNMQVPIRKYVVAELSEYLARLHACKGFEDHIEQRTANPEDIGGSIWDVNSGPFARSIMDHEGFPFMRRVNGESCLCFSMFVDWFNPHSGKHHSMHSTGAIYLICLNLPAHLRHKREYTFQFANIPGPKEPSMEQVNHVLRPIVNQLLELWRTGIWLRRTQSYRYGRICRGILINISGDIPGIQKIGGFASHSSSSFCFLCQSPRSDLHNLNLESWGKAWSYQEHQDIILSWKNAETEDERLQIYRDYGFRYSELSRLPYFDIIRATALDSMHIMPLGLQKDYGENILGMKGRASSDGLESGSSDSDSGDLGLSGEDDEMSLGEGSGTRAATTQIMKDLTASNSTLTVQKLASKPTSVLFNLCKEYDIFLYYTVYHGKWPQRNEMAKLLIQKVWSLRSCLLV